MTDQSILPPLPAARSGPGVAAASAPRPAAATVEAGRRGGSVVGAADAQAGRAGLGLDAGAGDRWRYREPGTGLEIGRSEGLAVASFHAFEQGLFSSDPAWPFKVDSAGLRALEPERLAAAFQVSDDNPLVGVDGRIALVRALGEAMAAAPMIFPGDRPGGLIDHLMWIAIERRAPSGSM